MKYTAFTFKVIFQQHHLLHCWKKQLNDTHLCDRRRNSEEQYASFALQMTMSIKPTSIESKGI